MNQNKLRLCGCVLMATMATCSQPGWAQEPAISPAPAKATTPDAGRHATMTPRVTAIRARVEQAPTPEGSAKAETGSWMVGTRVTQFELLEDTRGTSFHNSFMGSIDKLKDEQDGTPNKLFIQYRLVKSPFWIGVSYDHVRAKTFDEGGTDGSVDLEGYVPYVQARWENRTRVVPYVEAGLAFYDASFDEAASWYANGRRTVTLDDSVMGKEIAGGAAVRIYKGLSIDFYAQYMDVEDVNGAYYILGNRGGDAIFTMSHVMYGIGAQYQF